MKRTIAVIVALGLLSGSLAIDDASAGWGKKPESASSDKRTEKPEWMKQAVRPDNLPDAGFTMGTLTRNAYSGWELDGRPLFLGGDCVIEMNGIETGMLEEGHQAIVMGPRIGDTLVAWRVRILPPDVEIDTYNSEVKLERSDVDPTVGKIISSPY